MDPEATGAAIGEAVSQADGASGTVSAAAVVTEKQPEITTEELSSIKDVLGTFSTSFKTSGASRSTNLQVGAATDRPISTTRNGYTGSALPGWK